MVTVGTSLPMVVTSPHSVAVVPVRPVGGRFATAGKDTSSVVKTSDAGAQAPPALFCAKARKKYCVLAARPDTGTVPLAPTIPGLADACQAAGSVPPSVVP